VSFNNLNCLQCNAQLKKVRGCSEDIPVRVIEGIEIKRCPLTYIGNKEALLLQAYKEWISGYLPNAGGWLDQPMKFQQAMRVIEKKSLELEEKKSA
jgi:hypothetical protein